jgi:hypothetical protein
MSSFQGAESTRVHHQPSPQNNPQCCHQQSTILWTDIRIPPRGLATGKQAPLFRFSHLHQRRLFIIRSLSQEQAKAAAKEEEEARFAGRGFSGFPQPGSRHVKLDDWFSQLEKREPSDAENIQRFVNGPSLVTLKEREDIKCKVKR